MKSISIMMSFLIGFTLFKLFWPIGITYLLIMQILSRNEKLKYLYFIDNNTTHKGDIQIHYGSFVIQFLLVSIFITSNLDFYIFSLISFICMILVTRDFLASNAIFFPIILITISYLDLVTMCQYPLCLFLFIIRAISVCYLHNEKSYYLMICFLFLSPLQFSLSFLIVPCNNAIVNDFLISNAYINVNRKLKVLKKIANERHIFPILHIKTKLLYLISHTLWILCCVWHTKSYCEYYIFSIIIQLPNLPMLYILSYLSNYKIPKNITKKELEFEMEQEKRAESLYVYFMNHTPNVISEIMNEYSYETFATIQDFTIV